MIPIVLISGMVEVTFFGFRTYKFLLWYKSSSSKRHNIMILAFAVSSMLFAISMTTTTMLDTKVFLFSRPLTIDPSYNSSNDIRITLSGIENMILLYIFIVPQVLAIPAETVAVAFFLRDFKDKIGKTTFWTIVILPPTLFLCGVFGPQLLSTTANAFVYADPRFLIFRIIGTAGWIAADFVIAFAYLLVARTLRRQVSSSIAMSDNDSSSSSSDISSSAHQNDRKILNYLVIAALSTILVSPTTNNWIPNASYPPFGTIARAFVVLASFLFSIGIYSVGLSMVQDAKLRHLARKYAKEYSLLDTLGNAQMEINIKQTVVRLIHEQAGAMEKETGVESSMTNDTEIRQYLDLVIKETKGKAQNSHAN